MKWPEVVSKHWLSLAFLFGFITDFLLLNRVDDKFDNAVLFFYVVLATLSLILFYVGIAEKVRPSLVRLLNKITPITMQYSFGGLLSGMLIFYGRSGDFLVSAPFLLLIIAVIFANELVKKRSDRLIYNLSVYFIGLFSFLVLMVPVLISDMGDIVFVGSGLLSLVIIFLLVKTLSRIIPNFLQLQKRNLVFVIGSLYVLLNSFYFLNIIPPIPLSLTELEIYQSVEKNSTGNYLLTKEEKPWFQELPLLPTIFRPIPGQGAYCFARVYAPTRLSTNIVHRWERVDSEGRWQELFKTSYRITGENKDGYRGYTTSKNLSSGKWRCSVENERGQVLGRKTFIIDTKKEPANLVTIIQ